MRILRYAVGGLRWLLDGAQVTLTSFLLATELRLESNRFTPLQAASVAAALFMGIMLSSPFVGALADKSEFASKTILALSSLLAAAASAFIAFGAGSAFWPLFLSRFTLGVALCAAPIAFALAEDGGGGVARMILFNLTWTVGVIGACALRLFIPEQHYSYLVFYAGAPYVLQALATLIFVHARPAAAAAVEQASLIVNVEADDEALLETDMCGDDDEEHALLPPPSLRSMTRRISKPPSPLLAYTSLVLIWTSTSFTYFGLLLFSAPFFDRLCKDPNLSILLANAAEAPGVVVAAVAFARIGGRWTQSASFLVTAGAAAALLFVSRYSARVDSGLLDATTLSATALAAAARASSSASHAVVWLTTMRLVAPRHRVLGLSASVAAAKVASIAAPYVTSFDFHTHDASSLLLLLTAALSLVACVASWLVIER